LLKCYRVNSVVGDRYGGEWPREQFRKLGVRYELSPRPKSDLYKDVLPLINSRQVELLDHPRCVAQLCSLERRAGRGGRDSIDHPPGSHDDVCNAVAGVLVAASARRRYDTSLNWVTDDVGASEAPEEQWARQQLLNSIYGGGYGMFGR
jgi:hypothetical protein